MAGLQEEALSCAINSSRHSNSSTWGVGNGDVNTFGPRREFSLLDDSSKAISLLLGKRVRLPNTHFGKKHHQQYVFNFYEGEDTYSTINQKCSRYLLSAGDWPINVADRLSLKFPLLANSRPPWTAY